MNLIKTLLITFAILIGAAVATIGSYIIAILIVVILVPILVFMAVKEYNDVN